MLLKGKVSVVTGGGRGIGRAVALALAGEGSDISLWDLKQELMEDTAAAVVRLGRKVLTCEVDVANTQKVEKKAKELLDKWKKVDILINNAGITRDNLLVRLKEVHWDQVLEVNLKGAFNCCKALVKGMMKNRSGKIVNVSSIVGLTGNPGQSNYAASKAGLIGFTKSLAKELAPWKINVNAVAPGFIHTPMTDNLPPKVQSAMLASIPWGRMGTPEDVAKVILFLVSEASDYITGEVIRVDGGMAM